MAWNIRSALVAAIGSEHASNYAIAPHVIEEVDLELLQEFLGRIGPARIKNDYRARCNKSGRRFIVQFLQDINDHPMGTNSATAMQKIIDGMLTAGCEATVASFLALTEKVARLEQLPGCAVEIVVGLAPAAVSKARV